MKFDIYCDESRPDLFTSKSAIGDKYLLIGGLWLPTEKRDEVKRGINALKERFGVRGEIKWKKVSPAHLDFYVALVDLFIDFGLDLRFRCIAVEAAKVDMVHYHESDSELGFYKFYYQLIHHWIFDFNEYNIFCDAKTHRVGGRLQVLQRCLRCVNLSSDVTSIQALPSHEVVIIQLTDFLLGIAGSRLNGSVQPDGAKEQVIQRLERRLDVPRLRHTSKSAQKFNVFVIDLAGGW